MSYPKVITLEVSPSKSTLSFDVLEPSKVVMETQPSTNYNFTTPSRAMNIVTKHVDDDAVPSLVDDATSSGMPSEDSLAIDSEDDGTYSSGYSRLGDVDGSADFALAGHRGRAVHSETRSSRRDPVLSVSTTSSGSDDDADIEDSTASKSRSVFKKSTAPARRGRKEGKGGKDGKDGKGRKGSKGSAAHGESDRSPSTSDTDDSIPQHTGRRSHRTSRWTDSHDALLKNMKEGGETWASIATALGRGKKEVQQRFKEIKADGKERAEKRPRKKNARAGDKSSSPKKSSKKSSQTHRKSMPHLSWSSEDDSTSASLGPESLDSDAQEQIYLQDQIRENLYPPYLSLEEDDLFTKRDCEVLATVDSKMKRGKWLEMQANFFNVTGRMVPISVFRDKCEAAEAEERERIREAKIKSWKAGLDHSAQFDPNEPCQAA